MISLIDFCKINDSDFSELEKLRNACRFGVFHLKNTQIPSAFISKIFQQMENFFDLSTDEKQLLKIKNDNSLSGYIPQGAETTRGKVDMKESLAFAEERFDLKYSDYPFAKLYGPNQWPQETSLSGFRQDITEYIEYIEKIASQLIKLITQSLGISLTNYHLYYHAPLHFRMKLNKYKHLESSNDFLVYEHTDMSLFNILLLDSPGLEIKNLKGEWHQVLPHEESFVVLLGELTEIWTKGEYKACVHRVRDNFSKKQRLSIPFFFYPSLLSHLKKYDFHEQTATLENELLGKVLFERLNSIY